MMNDAFWRWTMRLWIAVFWFSHVVLMLPALAREPLMIGKVLDAVAIFGGICAALIMFSLTKKPGAHA